MRIAGTIESTGPVAALDIFTVGPIAPFAGPIPTRTTIDLFSLTYGRTDTGYERVFWSAGGGLVDLCFLMFSCRLLLRGGRVTVSAIPLQVGLPLFAAALSGLGFVGHRRRRR